MADNQPTDKPMELPSEDWREILRILHTGLNPQSTPHIGGGAAPSWMKPLINGVPEKGVHVSMVAITKPKDEKRGKGNKKDAPIDKTSLLDADGSPLRTMLNAMRSADGKKTDAQS